MNKVLSWVMAAALTSGLNVAMASCSSNDDNSATTKRGQLLEVYDVQGSEGKARLTVDGKVLFVTDVYVGKSGLGGLGFVSPAVRTTHDLVVVDEHRCRRVALVTVREIYDDLASANRNGRVALERLGGAVDDFGLAARRNCFAGSRYDSRGTSRFSRA